MTEPTGAVVELVSGNREFVARGYVDREHAIAVRIVARDPSTDVAPGKGTIAARFARAAELRGLLYGASPPQAMRVWSGESEGLPGRHRRSLRRLRGRAVAVGRGAALARRALRRHRSRLASARHLRTAAPSPAGGRRSARACDARARRRGAAGAGGRRTAGCSFGVDVTAPLGVGLFPDMRLGWAAVAARSPGRKVLNLFSYTGAFSVHAAKAGARRGGGGRRRGQGARARPPQLRAVGAGSGQAGGDHRATRSRRWSGSRRAGARSTSSSAIRRRFRTGPAGQFSVARDLAQLASACVAVLAPGGFLVFATNSTKISVAPSWTARWAKGAAGQARTAHHRTRRRCRPTIRWHRDSRRGTTSRSRSRSACRSRAAAA